MGRRQWSKQLVIDALRAIDAAGRPLTRRANRELAGPARYYFGSWQAAIIAAGLEPARGRPWTRQRVVEAILHRNRLGLPLTNVCKHHPTLATAALRLFDSWDEALKATGLPVRDRWTKQRVIAAIRDRYDEGNVATTWRDDPELYRATANHFGCWGTALQVADVPRPRRTWSKERVIIELRRWRRHRSATSLTKADIALAAAARKYFGSLKNALAAADLEMPPRLWTRELIIERIQDRLVTGQPLRPRFREDSSLCYAVRHYFGDWDAALRAAGIREAAS